MIESQKDKVNGEGVLSANSFSTNHSEYNSRLTKKILHLSGIPRINVVFLIYENNTTLEFLWKRNDYSEVFFDAS
jgi:hypothetical protein